MPSFRRSLGIALGLALAGAGTRAQAQVAPQGFAVNRFYPSAPGGGWFVMDDLDLHGSLGGALALTVGYAHDPLRVTGGANSVAVVSNEAVTDVGGALTYDRWRLYFNVTSPFLITGQSGTVGDYSFTGPSLNLGSNPDAVSDVRLGADLRIVGAPRSRFRLGAGAQLFIPFGNRADYDTDGTLRGTVRTLCAGDVRSFTWACQLGVHLRPLDDSPTPGSPRGSEMLFGVGAGAKIPVGMSGQWVAVVGPEIYGATAFRSFLGSNGTALESLLSGRIEGTRDDQMQVRVKLGVGVGLVRKLGAAEWRVVVGVEMFNHNQRDRSAL